MRRLSALLGLGLLVVLGNGCRHIGGKCDCGPLPGDLVGCHLYDNTCAGQASGGVNHVIPTAAVVSAAPAAAELPAAKKVERSPEEIPAPKDDDAAR